MVRPWSCEIQRGLHLSRNRYFGGSARHSNRFACRDHAVTLSYSLVRLGFVAQGAPAATTTSVKSKTSIRIRWQSEAAIIITPSVSGARRYVALKDGQAERCGAPEEVAGSDHAISERVNIEERRSRDASDSDNAVGFRATEGARLSVRQTRYGSAHFVLVHTEQVRSHDRIA